MAAPKQNTTKKEQDRIGLILYCFYIFLLFVGLAVFGRMLYIMFVWAPTRIWSDTSFLKAQGAS